VSGLFVLDRAAAGELPEWARASENRREHMDRVASLMGEWAETLHLGDADRSRWIAAGRLHDVYRDADAETMRPWLDGCFAELPESFQHGPAAAARLSAEGVDDGDLLNAIRFHTLGNHRLAPIGRALIAADFLEPGRKSSAEWRARQRDRMPDDLDDVIADVVRAKLEHGLESGMPVRQEMVRLWNTLVGGSGSG
jgi:HD superfamily phosphohydrolase YqeK